LGLTGCGWCGTLCGRVLCGYVETGVPEENESMEVTPEEAKESLAEIEKVAARTRKMVAYGGGDVLFIVWGVIWILGSMGDEFFLEKCGWIWLGLVGTGVAVTGLVAKFKSPVSSPTDRRLGFFWLFMFLYIGLWLWMLIPFVKIRSMEEGIAFSKHFGGIMFTAPMFGWVVMGLWLDRFMVWLGLAVTGLVVIGLILLEPYFWYWMAAAGGGTLIGTGLFIRKRWR